MNDDFLMIKSFVDFADNFKIMMNKLKLFFKKVWYIYNQALKESKVRLSNKLRGVSIFRDVTAFVISFAMFQIYEQYKRLCYEFTIIPTCIDSFNKIMRLSCTHKIQERLYNRASGEIFKLKNFYFYWRYIKSIEQEKNIEIFETSSTIDRYIV